MRYELNDLLDEGQVEELTAEVFGGGNRRKSPWKRAAALAACVLLAVGLLNFDAIAAEAQRLWSYVAGVGAVEANSQILVQGEDLVWTLEGRSYTLSGAYEKDGILTMHVLLRSEAELDGDAWFDITLLKDAKPCSTVWGDDAERSQTPFQTEAVWENQEERWGFVMPEAYRGSGSFAGTSPSFYTDGSGQYTVEIWRATRQGSRYQREGTPLSAELKLQSPQSQSFVEHAVAQDGGTLTALVGEEGRRVAFYLDGARDGLSLRCPYDVWFVDTEGTRYRGAMVSGPANISTQSVEVRLETVPSKPIACVEVGALLLSKDDSTGKFLGYESRESLNWVIPVA